MYEAFFGLREAPFTLTPNTHFFLQSETHRQGLEMLLVALKNKEGFLKITGEVGTGKTLLCRKLLNALGDNYVTAYIPNPHFSAETLYCVLADELGAQQAQQVNPIYNQIDGYLNQDVTSEKHVLALKRINDCLIRFANEGKQVVLIIDEAQAMPEETIEALRLLTNLETESAKLLQVVLFGQPELERMLDQKHLRQLRQRITFAHRISPLSRRDIEHYISHRMLLAGYQGGRLFQARAITLLTQASRGIPRLVNILCHKSLMLAYGEGQRVVTVKHMRRAIADTESIKRSRLEWLPWPSVAVLACIEMLPKIAIGSGLL
ncbi:MAG: AAA family ATPase [Oleiphilaceae bacterium]|nr:AAA family ATPase [Oleiphilaceae bacterium]